MPHPNVDPSLSREVEQPSLSLEALGPGQIVRLELAEGSDFERHLTLDAQLTALPPDGECHEFEVIRSKVPERTIETNRKFGLPNEDFIGQRFLVRGGCNYAKGYHPTMVHVAHIDLNRSIWLSFELPEDSKGASMEYFPYVRSYSLLSE